MVSSYQNIQLDVTTSGGVLPLHPTYTPGHFFPIPPHWEDPRETNKSEKDTLGFLWTVHSVPTATNSPTDLWYHNLGLELHSIAPCQAGPAIGTPSPIHPNPRGRTRLQLGKHKLSAQLDGSQQRLVKKTVLKTSPASSDGFSCRQYGFWGFF